MTDLDFFFNPSSIAVIGASDNVGSVGYEIMKNLTEDFPGELYPINIKKKLIFGKSSYKSILDVPNHVDMAVVAIAAPYVADILEECGKKGVKGVVIVSGGFSEIGEKEREDKLVEISKKYGIRIIGPNCIGIYDNFSGVNTIFLSKDKVSYPQKGNISFLSQSGAFAGLILDWTSKERIGISKVVSYGNKIDVNEADLIDYLYNDETSKVICLYIEGIRRGRRFMESAKKATKRVPILALKSGKTKSGAKAASSHTGSLAGEDKIYESAFKQSHIIRANNFEELFDMAKALEKQVYPTSDGVAILTNAGGLGVMTADALEMNGLRLANLSEYTVNKLKEQFPERVVVSNPMDLVGDADKERYEIGLKALLEDQDVGLIIVILLLQVPTLSLDSADLILDIKRNSNKPILILGAGGEIITPCLRKLEKGGLAIYPSPERAARAAYALINHAIVRGDIHRERKENIGVCKI
ncbi:MAG: succinyl-CoA synthetase subunit alpha [Candidatus Methanofastidiosum methylothiophilum]|uniref:acetate--CoA ligase (ADP-forming) n=1 Tax=Candidatus Methanofastidiosum methylothiophilum TaxID=1705564 RepID=A0A150IRQ5_9EURY|nr:MAG: succinyl-CoA synthetase subunit alpha [Candidatus Methanofastidiosum methylthiophilus]KYC47647.1 MAG: succinyl-CoA synthetase subunit alpha [Candidatus Methanofastidiosum methylthiophilus]KYC50108.1 MAG: succinyl-CoA synthetase subunit alpha [Candidatus Methanofastidiosum methylthiophilus]